MKPINEPYILVTRRDKVLSHIKDRTGPVLCNGETANDWQSALYGDKPICGQCLKIVEDREYRSRDGGRSGMVRAG